jgi:hypothetical protein
MSKKQKRRVSSSASPVLKTAAPMPAVNTNAVQARVRSQIFEFKPDYSYIKGDLKRISLLAGSFLVVLIILSFVLPLILK